MHCYGSLLAGPLTVINAGLLMFGDLNFLYQKAPNFFYNRNTNTKLMFLNISKPVKCYRIQSIYIVKREMEKKIKETC